MRVFAPPRPLPSPSGPPPLSPLLAPLSTFFPVTPDDSIVLHVGCCCLFCSPLYPCAHVHELLVSCCYSFSGRMVGGGGLPEGAILMSYIQSLMAEDLKRGGSTVGWQVKCERCCHNLQGHASSSAVFYFIPVALLQLQTPRRDLASALSCFLLQCNKLLENILFYPPKKMMISKEGPKSCFFFLL